jgi:uncharacterized protein (UPF0276 family)
MSRHPLAARAGIGLRTPHVAEIERDRPATAFLEVHAENYMAGGPGLARLQRLRRDYAVSVHGVGLSLGSAEGIDAGHLARLAALVERIEPALVSEHLSWSVAGGAYLNDLLPLPYTDEALDVFARNVDCAQETLKRPLLIENPSAYVGFAHSTMSEPEFLRALVRRTGCRLLLDVNNVYVSGRNMDFDTNAWIDAVPALAVAEIHLAGHAVADADGAPILIDDHGSRVSDGVWALYAHALRAVGPTPTLIEWDTDLPPLPVLLEEAAHADRMLAAAEGASRAA